MKKHRFFAFLLCFTLCLGLLSSAMASSEGFTDGALYLIVFDMEMQDILKESFGESNSSTYLINAETYFGEEAGSVYFDMDTYEVIVYSLGTKTTYSFFDDDIGFAFTACCFIKLDTSGAVAMKGGVRVFCTFDGVTQEAGAKQVANIAEIYLEALN